MGPSNAYLAHHGHLRGGGLTRRSRWCIAGQIPPIAKPFSGSQLIFGGRLHRGRQRPRWFGLTRSTTGHQMEGEEISIGVAPTTLNAFRWSHAAVKSVLRRDALRGHVCGCLIERIRRAAETNLPQTDDCGRTGMSSRIKRREVASLLTQDHAGPGQSNATRLEKALTPNRRVTATLVHHFVPCNLPL